MNIETFAPLFGTVVLSSLWDEPDPVVKVFLTMLACKDRDHVVRMTAYNIGKAARKSEAEVLDALRVLSAPDTKRLEPQPHEGRRIEKRPEGWLILNGDKYQKVMEGIFRKAKNAQRMREARATGRGTPLPGESEYQKIFREQGQEAADKWQSEHTKES